MAMCTCHPVLRRQRQGLSVSSGLQGNLVDTALADTKPGFDPRAENPAGWLLCEAPRSGDRNTYLSTNHRNNPIQSGLVKNGYSTCEQRGLAKAGDSQPTKPALLRLPAQFADIQPA